MKEESFELDHFTKGGQYMISGVNSHKKPLLFINLRYFKKISFVIAYKVLEQTLHKLKYPIGKWKYLYLAFSSDV